MKMNPYTVAALFIFSILIYEGINLVFFTDKKTVKKDKRFIFFSIKNKFTKINEKSIEQEFNVEKISNSLTKYYISYIKIRYFILLIIIIYIAFKTINQAISIIPVILFIVLYISTIPKMKILKKLTPFGYIIKQFDKEFRKKQDAELSSIIIQLQNIAISQKEEPTTLTYMLSRIVRFTKYTRNGFIKMISNLDQGKENEARDTFINEINTNLGRDLAYVLIQLDSIEPVKVINQLKMLEERIRNDNLTNKNHNEELYSNLIYIIPTTLCFAILMNFLNVILKMVMNFKI